MRHDYEDDAEEEKILLDALEKGKLKTSRSAQKEMQAAKIAARNYLRKDARVNMRLSQSDLLLLKRRAASEGMPYQTLLASVVHKYVTGQFG